MNKQLHSRQILNIQNSLADCEKLHSFLITFAEVNDIPAETYHDLRLVVEEVFINIISYAYTDTKSHVIAVELNDTGETISITFTDSGIAFNPITDCDENSSKTDHCEGGMGIDIIKSLTDSRQYYRINQHNVFTVTKLYTKKN
jgi:anti-sigma regulatory factor (Ser/Thr protein kinase)